jgi:hypothetical protein
VTKSIEAIAELYRQRGWEKQARELEADAQRFKAEGMPEQFEANVQEKQEPVQALKRQLVEILAAEQINPIKPKNETYLSPELAARLNQVGQKFDDSTPLNELLVKTKGIYAEFFIPGQPSSEAEQTYKIDVRLVKSYNSLLNRFHPQSVSIKTVGQVRGATQYELLKQLYVPHFRTTDFPNHFEAEQRIQFLKNTLARPPQQDTGS